MLQGFFVSVLSVRLRLRLFPLFRSRPFPLSAAGFFFSSFPLAFLCFFTALPDGSQKCAWRRFLRKGESFFIGAFKQAKTYENQPGKKPVSGNMGLNHRAYNFYSCNFKN